MASNSTYLVPVQFLTTPFISDSSVFNIPVDVSVVQSLFPPPNNLLYGPKRHAKGLSYLCHLPIGALGVAEASMSKNNDSACQIIPCFL